MRVGILIMLAVLAMGTNGALAAISISNTLSPSYGVIDYSIDSDCIKTGNYAITENQGASSTYVAVTGVNGYGGSYFDADMDVDTNYGDWAWTNADFDYNVKVDNFNLYGYMTPNLAWAGQYTEYVKADSIDFETEASTRDEDYDPIGYQETDVDWYTSGSTDTNADFSASQVYITSQAGGSYDSTEFNVGTENAWGGEGTYAMSNVEYGSFSIAATTRADSEYWDLCDQEAYAYDFDDDDIYVDAAEDNYFEYGPLTFTINTPAISYADADMVYANTDLGVTGHAGAEMDLDYAEAEWDYYFPYSNRYKYDDLYEEYIPLSSFDNVFIYGYINAPQDIFKLDLIYY